MVIFLAIVAGFVLAVFIFIDNLNLAACQAEREFVIRFSNDSTAVNMDFVWDKTQVRVRITVQ